jgi:hypothetical protein
MSARPLMHASGYAAMMEPTTARSPRPFCLLVAAGIFVVWARNRTSRALASLHGRQEFGAEVVAQLPCLLRR